MRHVMSLSPVPSGDCAYFPSPRGCTTPLALPSPIFLGDLCASVAIPVVCFNSGRLWRLCLGPASARFCSRSFSGLRRELGSRRCARTRGGGVNTRSILRAFPSRENTICFHSHLKCLCPSQRVLTHIPG